MEFSYDAVPTDEIPALPAASQEVALDEFRGILSSGRFELAELRAGFLFDRKGHFSVDTVDDLATRNYRGREDDDVVVQLTLRVERPVAERLITRARADRAEEIETERLALLQAKQAERARLDAEIEALQTKRASL